MPTPLVCVADDDQLIHFTFKKLITGAVWPVEVLPFYDGEQLLKYLAANAGNADALPGVIILDINMPFVDGWEFLEHYKTIKAGMKRIADIYIIASHTTEKDLSAAKANPDVKACIMKPVTKEKIDAIFKV